jgi:AcrR family transcriptional regulator
VGKGELTRRAILDQAVAMAARVGLGGLTIGGLATITGMSKSGLYAHFDSKESLQVDVVEHARDAFVDLVVGPALRTPRGEPRLRALFEHWLAAGLARQPGCTVLVQSAMEFDEQVGAVHDVLVRDHRDLHETIAQIVRTAISEEHFRDGVDPEQFAYDLYAVMLGVYHASRLLDDPRARIRARNAFEALLVAARR